MRKVVIVDENDNVVGYEEVEKAHKNPVPLHRAISILIVNGDKMLITKRAGMKKTWPNFWSNAVCTNVFLNESYEEAAKRRVKEELGLEGIILKKLFKFVYEAKSDEVWGEHEMDQVFVCEHDGDFHHERAEITDCRWIERSDLLKSIKVQPEKYTPWFKIIIKRFYQS